MSRICGLLCVRVFVTCLDQDFIAVSNAVCVDKSNVHCICDVILYGIHVVSGLYAHASACGIIIIVIS